MNQTGSHLFIEAEAGSWPGMALVASTRHESCSTTSMLKLIGSYVIAKVLGFGIVGAIVIYFLLTLFGR